jgi:hypothetical protein
MLHDTKRNRRIDSFCLAEPGFTKKNNNDLAMKHDTITRANRLIAQMPPGMAPMKSRMLSGD